MFFNKSNDPKSAEDAAAREKRDAEWEQALKHGRVPGFVKERLTETAAGKRPWISNMGPGELALARSHGIRPLGLVSGNCWLHYGYSWTNGHRTGWRTALDRMLDEAAVLGAHAVVDVTLKASRLGEGENKDYAMIGTAVKIEGHPVPERPVAATVSTLEFVRMLELGVVPVGVAIGTHYAYHYGDTFSNRQSFSSNWTNTEAQGLSTFAAGVRRKAIADLRADAASQGSGVLGDTQFFEMLCIEGDDNTPPRYLGRYIAMGTVVHHQKAPMAPWYANADERMAPGSHPRLRPRIAVDLADNTSLSQLRNRRMDDVI